MSSQRSIPTVDIISNLPDSLICHILSFLPTKTSAATSILSKRWKPLWHSVLTLDFDDRSFTDFATFRHFVYSVMLTRNTALPLQSFRLKCGTSPGCDPQDINRFVPVAVQKGIESLFLDFSNTCFDFQIRLGPTRSSVFSCKNLVVLKLKRLILNVVPQFDFPLLKTLHLDNIYHLGDYNEFFNKIVEGCPVLEELQTNVQVPLRVPNDIDGGEFKSFSNLVRANISNYNWNIPFSWICNAKFLRLEVRNELKVHTLHNLTHMELVFASTWQTKWKWLVEVLEHCPKLQNLTLDQLYGYGKDEDDWKKPEIVPECISSQLRAFSLTSYKGKKCEHQFAKYIMKNAKVMRIMTISTSVVDININHQMLLKLSSCPRSSPTCKFSFSAKVRACLH